jgi:prolyl-tRNA synthetase
VQIVIIPIIKNENDMAEIREFLKPLIGSLKEKGVRLQLDDRLKVSPGFKFNEWEMKGVPIRVEAGPKDMKSGTVLCVRSDY